MGDLGQAEGERTVSDWEGARENLGATDIRGVSHGSVPIH